MIKTYQNLKQNAKVVFVFQKFLFEEENCLDLKTTENFARTNFLQVSHLKGKKGTYFRELGENLFPQKLEILRY